MARWWCAPAVACHHGPGAKRERRRVEFGAGREFVRIDDMKTDDGYMRQKSPNGYIGPKPTPLSKECLVQPIGWQVPNAVIACCFRCCLRHWNAETGLAARRTEWAKRTRLNRGAYLKH